MSLNVGTETVRETVASEIMAELERTANRAERTSALVAEKTSCVTREEPATDRKDEDNVESVYPPLFSRIRELTENINKSLARIEDNMHRIEL